MSNHFKIEFFPQFNLSLFNKFSSPPNISTFKDSSNSSRALNNLPKSTYCDFD